MNYKTAREILHRGVGMADDTGLEEANSFNEALAVAEDALKLLEHSKYLLLVKSNNGQMYEDYREEIHTHEFDTVEEADGFLNDVRDVEQVIFGIRCQITPRHITPRLD